MRNETDYPQEIDVMLNGFHERIKFSDELPEWEDFANIKHIINLQNRMNLIMELCIIEQEHISIL